MRQFREIILFIIFLIISIISTACNSAGNSNSTSSPSLTSITINANNSQIANGTATNITATGIFSNGTTQDLTKQVAWSSSDTNIVQITESGVAKGVTVGTAGITASYQGVTSTSLSILVTDAVLKDIIVNINHAAKLAKGTATQLTATGVFNDNTTQDLTTQVAWNSSNSSVVSITPDGIISGDNIGNAEVTASLFGGVASSPVTVSVSAATLTAITVNIDNSIMAKGTSSQLTAIGTFSDHSTQNLTNQVAWTSSDNGIVTVTAAGTVSAAGVGNSNIIASYQGVTSIPTAVTVSPAIIVGITLNTSTNSIAKGTSIQLTATGILSDGTSQDLTSQVAWQSSNNSIASVTNSGLVTGLIAGQSANITASYGGVSSSPVSISVTNAVLTGIIVNPGSTSLAKGTSIQLTATGIMSDGSIQDLTNQAVWQSKDSSVVTVSSNGLVTGRNIGTAGVTATFGGFTSSSVMVTINEAVLVSITVNIDSNILAKGTSSQLTATGTFSDHSTQDLTSLVAWNSSNNGIVSVTINGMATAVTIGNSNITASYHGVTSVSASVTVSPAVITGITINSGATSLAKGTSVQLSATGTFSDGTSQDLTNSVAWKSGNNSIATVTNDGLVTGVTAGQSTNVTAIYGGISSSPVSISVTNAVLKTIVVNTDDSSIAKGTNTQLSATGVLSDGSTIDLTNQAVWQSTDSNKVAVNSSGLVSAVGVGVAGVTATFGGFTSVPLTITVTDAVLTGITVNADDSSIAKGTSSQLTATGSYSDGSTQDLTNQATWHSDNDSIVAVTAGGLVTGRTAGQSTTVTAKFGGFISTPVTITVSDAVVKSISISTTNTNPAKGTSAQLTSVGTLSDGTTQDLTNQVTWHSDNDSIVTVTTGGMITAVKAGSTIITAKFSSVTSSIPITVTAAVIQSISILNLKDSFAKGTTTQLYLIAQYSDGESLPISGGVTWQSSNNSIVNVTTDGVANADTEGSATITAFYQGLTSSPITLTVTSATLKSIVITGNNSLTNGTNGQLVATGAFSDQSKHDVTNDVTWQTSNNTIVNVNQDGSISANSVGTATITAKKGTIQATYLVTVAKVVPPTLTSILITGDNYMEEDSSNKLMATGIYSDQTYTDLTTKVAWGTSNQFVATVGNDGLVSSTHYGSTNITASYEGASSSFKMTVLYGKDTAKLASLSLDLDPYDSLHIGQLAILTATGSYSDGTQRIISLKSLLFTQWQNPGTYNINLQNGIITALAPGEGGITARNFTDTVSSNSIPIKVLWY